MKSCTSGGRLPNHVITARTIEELLEEEEIDLTDINTLIYPAAKVMTQTLIEPGKKKQK